jgi:hypothetical protein
MTWIITTRDAEIRYESEAETLDQACEEMAQSIGYDSYNSLCRDLGYSGRSFDVSQIIVGERKAVDTESRPRLFQDMARTSLNAFKFNRRNRAAN